MCCLFAACCKQEMESPRQDDPTPAGGALTRCEQVDEPRVPENPDSRCAPSTPPPPTARTLFAKGCACKNISSAGKQTPAASHKASLSTHALEGLDRP